MKAMIFAAGLGTRLRPLTDRMPKALVPVGGVPMLEQVIIKLKDAGYDEIVVNVHHFAEQIEDFLKEKENFGINISISDERDLLRETGGGIRHASSLLKGESPFLVHNVDILSNLDFGWFSSQHRTGDLSTILVSKRKTQRYFLFDDEMKLVGWTNIATGEVRSPYQGIDPDQCTMYAFSGIHLMSQSILPLMEEWPEKFPIVEFYLEHCRRHTIRGAVADNLEIHDIGKISDINHTATNTNTI